LKRPDFFVRPLFGDRSYRHIAGGVRYIGAMIQRFDQLVVDLPEPNGPNPAAAAAVQELMGGKFGELSTLMNYTFQSFNSRGREKYRPFYDVICNIAAEEYSDIEAVAAKINLRLNGATRRADRSKTPMPAGGSTALEAEGLHTIMWHWSPSDQYTQLAGIWNGLHPEDGQALEVRDEMPPGFPWPDFPEEPQLCAPGGIDPEMMAHYAKKLG